MRWAAQKKWDASNPHDNADSLLTAQHALPCPVDGGACTWFLSNACGETPT
jgi:hypothetical protein